MKLDVFIVYFNLLEKSTNKNQFIADSSRVNNLLCNGLTGKDTFFIIIYNFISFSTFFSTNL